MQPIGIREFTAGDLQQLERDHQFRVQPANKVTAIGVIVRDLLVHLDGRGDVTELWSDNWLKDGYVTTRHVYQSATEHGVVKAWHLHEEHTDQFAVTRGKLQVSLVDLRHDSPTYLHANAIFLGAHRAKSIVIPPGIMHGWKALTAPEVIVVNCQSHVYDVNDELKFPWDCALVDIWEPKNG